MARTLPLSERLFESEVSCMSASFASEQGSNVQRPTFGDERDPTSNFTLAEIRASLKNMRYGSVTIIIQDGVVVQIDRVEKRRPMPQRRALQRDQ
jgi:hypothetical protein